MYSKVIEVNGIKLSYYESGIGQPLIFLHGNSQSSFTLKKIFKYYSSQYHVIAIDSRGHGKSERGETKYNIKLMANDVEEFIKLMNLKNVIIIGYSDGGNIAYTVAINNKDVLDKIVLISFLENRIILWLPGKYPEMYCVNGATEREMYFKIIEAFDEISALTLSYPVFWDSEINLMRPLNGWKIIR